MSILPASHRKELLDRSILPGWDDAVYQTPDWTIIPFAVGLQCPQIAIKRALCITRNTKFETSGLVGQYHQPNAQAYQAGALPSLLQRILSIVSQEPYTNPHPIIMDAPTFLLEPDWLGLGFEEVAVTEIGRILFRKTLKKTLAVFYDLA